MLLIKIKELMKLTLLIKLLLFFNNILQLQTEQKKTTLPLEKFNEIIYKIYILYNFILLKYII